MRSARGASKADVYGLRMQTIYEHTKISFACRYIVCIHTSK